MRRQGCSGRGRRLQKRKIARKKEKQRTGEGGGASNSLRDLDGERAGFTKIDQGSMGWKKTDKEVVGQNFWIYDQKNSGFTKGYAQTLDDALRHYIRDF